MIDGANLALAPDTLAAALDGDGALVALPDDGDTTLGAIVLECDRIAAVAVRPGRRGQGIGTALVAAAGARRSRLVAEFDTQVERFWRSLEFSIEGDGDGRCRGVR